jgi:replicative DNA helicase
VKIDISYDKVLPQNIEAEQSVLGAILIDNEAISSALEILSPSDFYRDNHRKIYSAMIELYERHEPIDLITITDYLRSTNLLDEVGGSEYMAFLATVVPTSANIRQHAKIVKEKALLRGLINAGTEIVKRVFEDPSDPDELLDFAEKQIFDISAKKVKGSFVSLKDLMADTFTTIERLYDRKEAITGIPSGFKDLDEYTSGFQNGDLIIIGGRPSMGKTAFGLNIARYVGVELREPVAIFSLEMSNQQIALRMLCSEAMVDSSHLKKGMIRKEDWHRLTAAAGRLAEAPIFIDDSSDTSVLEMRAKARRLKMEKGLSLIIVDYLQLMKGRGNFERREQEISEISRGLKALAKELDVPVIALSQLNRAVEQRIDKRPTLADLRESGAIEQDADVILFLYRDDQYNKNSPEKNVAEVNIAKQRNGPAGVTVKLTFLSHCTRFFPYTERTPVDMEEDF